MASYVIISPNPEDNGNRYIERMAKNNGLKSACPDAKLIGWNFPFVSQEQQNRFGMYGCVAAYVIPESFDTSFQGCSIQKMQKQIMQ